MMDRSVWRAVRLWAVGALLLGLRLLEGRLAFDPETGLALPSPLHALPVALLAAAAVWEALSARRFPAERAAYTAQFAPPERSLAAGVAGCFLLIAGGGILAAGALAAGALVDVAAGALAAAAGLGLLLLLRKARAGDEPSVLLALPAMLFGVVLVLSVYIPAETDPVLARIYLPILAAALATCAFSQLGGFLRRDSRPRTFVRTAGLAVPLCLGAAAGAGTAMALLYAGCALTLTVFLLLLRDTPPGGAAPRSAGKRVAARRPRPRRVRAGTEG